MFCRFNNTASSILLGTSCETFPIWTVNVVGFELCHMELAELAINMMSCLFYSLKFIHNRRIRTTTTEQQQQQGAFRLGVKFFWIIIKFSLVGCLLLISISLQHFCIHHWVLLHMALHLLLLRQTLSYISSCHTFPPISWSLLAPPLFYN
jgi:hypothetical protein